MWNGWSGKDACGCLIMNQSKIRGDPNFKFLVWYPTWFTMGFCNGVIHITLFVITLLKVSDMCRFQVHTYNVQWASRKVFLNLLQQWLIIKRTVCINLRKQMQNSCFVYTAPLKRYRLLIRLWIRVDRKYGKMEKRGIKMKLGYEMLSWNWSRWAIKETRRLPRAIFTFWPVSSTYRYKISVHVRGTWRTRFLKFFCFRIVCVYLIKRTDVCNKKKK